MKKRVWRLLCVFVVFSLFALLTACGTSGGDGYSGTYYAYKDGVKQSDDWIKLDKDGWSDCDGNSGRIEEKDGVLYCYAKLFGEEDVMFFGSVTDGAFEYSLDGKIWYTYYADGNDAENKNSGMHAKGDSSETITPTPAKTQYTVSFDSKGGSSVPSKSVGEGEKLTAPTQPTKTMFIFNGWYKESSCKNVWDFDTDLVTKDITLYAKWQADEVRVTSVNGATIDGNNITVIVNDTVDEMDMSDKVVLNSDTATWKLYFDKAGESEIRTKIAANRSGYFAPGNNLFYIVVTSADETQAKPYVLNIYQKYEVEVLIHDVYQGLVDRYTAYTTEILRTPQATTFTGYTFLGWRTTDATFGEPVPMDSERVIHVYPNVTPNTYRVTLNAGNDATIGQTNYTVTYDGNVRFDVPEKTGYSFKAWTYGEDVTDASGSGKWTIATDVTLTARYTPNTYDLSASVNDENAGTAEITGSNTYGETVTLIARTNDGYTFLGWYVGNQRVSADLRTTLSVPAKNTTYTAKWTYYTVTTGSTGGGRYTSYSEKKITAGQEVTLTAETNYGYTWLGWYDGDTKVSEGASLSYTFTMPAKNKTYTARWELDIETLIGNLIISGTAVTGVKDKAVTMIIVPDYITEISFGAFSGCSSLESITIPFVGAVAGKTSSDTYQYPFGYIFGTSSYTGGTATTQYYYGSSTSNTTNTTYYVPTSLRSVTVTGGNLLYGAFYGCTGLTSITIPDSVTSIGSYAFSGCYGLTSVYYTGDIASWCGITFNGSGSNPLSYAYNLYLDNELATEIVIPDTVTEIKNYAFQGWNGTSITIPDSVTSIGEWAFYDCTGLTSITIPDSVTSIGYAAFNSCTRLTSVTIPDSVTSIGRDAFSNCSSLQYNEYDNGCYLGNDTNPYVVFIKAKNRSITSCTIHEDTKVICDYAFKGRAGLTSITIPDGVTSIGEDAFSGCSSLKSVTIGNGVTSIGENAFYNCPIVTAMIPTIAISHVRNKYLKSVVITSGESIGEQVLYHCSSLTSITIPDNVTSIGREAFSDCTGLMSITFTGTKAQWNAIDKLSSWNYHTGNYTIHCTDGDIAK